MTATATKFLTEFEKLTPEEQVLVRNQVISRMNNPMKYKLEKGTLTITGCDPKPTGDLIIPDAIDGFPVTNIGNSAFAGCIGLKSVKIPSSVILIGNGAFYRCSGLANVTLPSSLTEIGYAAFLGCTGLTSVIIPGNVTLIGAQAFTHCKALTSVMIPDNVTSIGYEAFLGCSGLTDITIPEFSLTSIGESAFLGCTSLTAKNINADAKSIIEVLSQVSNRTVSSW